MSDESKTVTVDQLQAENDRLRAELAEKNSLPGVPRGLEEDVRRRVAAGLSLRHAIEAAKSQAENDERIAKEEKDAKKK